MNHLIEGVLKGDVRDMARLISIVENEGPESVQAIKDIFPHTGNSFIVGFTGPSGAGKSTLVDKVTLHLCNRDKKVGIIAIDPSSPFSGGALLGDRIRMRDITTKQDVFIRSLSTRGSMGGLSRAAGDIAKILDASGKDFIIIETVGVGQDEVDIFKTADTSVVVLMPGGGDEIQSIKAGLMEIGDIFVVNKADKEGTEGLINILNQMLDLNSHQGQWRPPVLKTVATRAEGIQELLDAIENHREFLLQTGGLTERRKKRYKAEILKIVQEKLSRLLHLNTKQNVLFDSLVEKVMDKKENPYSCAEKIVAPLLQEGKR